MTDQHARIAHVGAAAEHAGLAVGEVFDIAAACGWKDVLVDKVFDRQRFVDGPAARAAAVRSRGHAACESLGLATQHAK